MSTKTYCLKCQAKTNNKNEKLTKTKMGRMMMRSVCTECGGNKARMLSNDQARALSRSSSKKSSRKASRKSSSKKSSRKVSRKASRKASRKTSKKSSRKASRKASRK
jgi:hypothetical protein